MRSSSIPTSSRSVWRAGLAACAIGCLAAAGAARAATVTDAAHGFTFQPPDGYHEFPPGRSAPRTLQSFIRGQGDSFAVLNIQAVGGTLPRAPIDRASYEANARKSVTDRKASISGFDYRKTRWKGFDLDLVASRLTAGDRQLIDLSVEVPLANEAIEINMLGPAGDEDKLLGELRLVLASLDGKPSWVGDRARHLRLGLLIGGGLALLILIGVKLSRRDRART